MGNSQGKEESAASTSLTESVYVQQILEARKNLTGWERLKLMFTTDEFGSLSPEVLRIIHTMCFSAVVGGLIGAIGRGRIAHMNFMRSNAHEAFESPLQAKRKLQDTVTLGMGSGAFRIGWRITFFTTVYMSVSTAVSTYRGKMGVIDQVLGAGTAGFIYKFPQGPRAQIAGTVIGSLLGLSAGIMTLGITKLTGETIDSANLRYYEIMAKKETEKVAAGKASMEVLRKVEPGRVGPQAERLEYDSLINFHEQLIVALEEKRQHEDSSSSTAPTTTGQQTENTSISQHHVNFNKSGDSSGKKNLNSESSVQAEKTDVAKSKVTNDALTSSKSGSSSNNNNQQIVSTSTG